MNYWPYGLPYPYYTRQKERFLYKYDKIVKKIANKSV